MAESRAALWLPNTYSRNHLSGFRMGYNYKRTLDKKAYPEYSMRAHLRLPKTAYACDDTEAVFHGP